KTRGWRVAGVLSPAVLQDGHKVAIDLVDLTSGTTRQLAASRRGDRAGETTERWRFDAAALTWGNEVLRSAAGSPFDVLMVDELGPLEFQRGSGLLAGLDAIDGLARGVAIVVVRPSLLEAATERWPDALVVDVED
ncbi:MAG: nucleoside-triphosphatase, partial [Trueperaceae bacterium]